MLVVLAALRASRAVSVDSITDPMRRRLQLASIRDASSARRRAVFHWLHELAKCPHCTGFWLAGLGVAGLHLSRRPGFRWVRWFTTWWAAAGAQSFLVSAQHVLDARGKLLESEAKLADERLKALRAESKR